MVLETYLPSHTIPKVRIMCKSVKMERPLGTFSDILGDQKTQKIMILRQKTFRIWKKIQFFIFCYQITLSKKKIIKKYFVTRKLWSIYWYFEIWQDRESGYFTWPKNTENHDLEVENFSNLERNSSFCFFLLKHVI